MKNRLSEDEDALKEVSELTSIPDQVFNWFLLIITMVFIHYSPHDCSVCDVMFVTTYSMMICECNAVSWLYDDHRFVVSLFFLSPLPT